MVRVVCVKLKSLDPEPQIPFQCGAVSNKCFQWCSNVPCKYSLGRPVVSQCTLGQPATFQWHSRKKFLWQVLNVLFQRNIKWNTYLISFIRNVIKKPCSKNAGYSCINYPRNSYVYFKSHFLMFCCEFHQELYMILFATLQKTRNYSEINEDMLVYMLHWQIS